jgi:hypothetical protein
MHDQKKNGPVFTSTWLLPLFATSAVVSWSRNSWRMLCPKCHQKQHQWRLLGMSSPATIFSTAMIGANTDPSLISSEINMWYTDGLKTSATHSWKYSYLLSSLHKVQTVRTCQDSFLLKFESYIEQVVNLVIKQSRCIITACYYTKAYNVHFCLNTLLWHVNSSLKDSFFWCY